MTMEPNKHEEEVCNDKLPPLSAKYPWLVVQDLEDRSQRFFSTLHNPMFKYQCRIPELSGKRIRGCFHGWIILSNHPHNDMWSLWNPSTSNTVSLPPLILKDGDYDSIRECCLSAPPDNPTSVILLMISNKRTFVFCKVSPKRKKSLRKKPRWTEMSYAYQLKRVTRNGHLLHSLTCCNGQIYALCNDSDIARFLILIEIVIKDREVVIQLIAVGSCSSAFSDRCFKELSFLTGTSTELFHIMVCFRTVTDRKPWAVYLFKLDMGSIDWKKLECLRHWDMSDDERFDQRVFGYVDDLNIIDDLWQEVQGVTDTIFVVDLARENSEYYCPAIASELGGYIHILDKMDKVIYSYHLANKTIVTFPMPSLLLPTSHVSMWEYRLEDDHREAIFIVDSKQQEDEMMTNLISNNEVEVGESCLLDIPFDVLEMMMKFCVGVEYMNFRATCKRCHLAAPLKQWRKHTSLMRLQDYSLGSPWLMVVNQIQGIITFTDPMLGDKYFMRCSQLRIADETICCSRFGWLLFKISEYYPAFFNPFTNDLRELPKTSCGVSCLWFSAPPTSPECMVVGFACARVLILYVARETTWQAFELDTRANLRPICFPTFHGEYLYALHKTGELMVFRDLGKDNVSLKVYYAQAPKSCSCSPAQYFLVKCDQRLLVVVMGGFGEPIEVFKLNESTLEWEKVYGVGKHMIYICDTTCLCIEAKIPEMENKIYLAQLSSRNMKSVFYSLETCTFHTFNGTSVQEKLGDAFPITHLSAHTWIEPSWLEKGAPESCTVFS